VRAILATVVTSAVKDGVIARMGRIAKPRAKRVIDAGGLVVAPGFIDLHTHYDAQIFWDPYLSTSGFHGVTSVVIGNCGFGFAPMAEAMRERAMLSMTRVEAIPLKTMQATLPWDWISYPQYLDSMDRVKKSVNILPYVPANPLLIWAMGFEAAKSGRRPTDAEHAEIARLLHEAMDAGACGWSAQCLGTAGRPDLETAGGLAPVDFDGTPMPSDVMWPETRALLAKVLGDRGEGFIALSMSFANPQEWEVLAQISNAPMLWQAVPPTGGEAGAGMRGYLFSWLKSCHERGLRIYGQGITQDPPLVFTFDCFDLWGVVWNQYWGPPFRPRRSSRTWPIPQCARGCASNRSSTCSSTRFLIPACIGPSARRSSPMKVCASERSQKKQANTQSISCAIWCSRMSSRRSFRPGSLTRPSKALECLTKP